MPDGTTPAKAGRTQTKVNSSTKRLPTTAEIKAALKRRDSRLSTLGPIAEALDVPLWTLLIPGVPEEFWRDNRQEGLIRTVREYVDGAQASTIDTASKDRADKRMISLQQDVIQATSIVSMAIGTLSAEENEVQYGLRAAYDILDRLFDRMDPVIFWREVREVAP